MLLNTETLTFDAIIAGCFFMAFIWWLPTLRRGPAGKWSDCKTVEAQKKFRSIHREAFVKLRAFCFYSLLFVNIMTFTVRRIEGKWMINYLARKTTDASTGVTDFHVFFCVGSILCAYFETQNLVQRLDTGNNLLHVGKLFIAHIFHLGVSLTAVSVVWSRPGSKDIDAATRGFIVFIISFTGLHVWKIYFMVLGKAHQEARVWTGLFKLYSSSSVARLFTLALQLGTPSCGVYVNPTTVVATALGTAGAYLFYYYISSAHTSPVMMTVVAVAWWTALVCCIQCYVGDIHPCDEPPAIPIHDIERTTSFLENMVCDY